MNNASEIRFKVGQEFIRKANVDVSREVGEEVGYDIFQEVKQGIWWEVRRELDDE